MALSDSSLSDDGAPSDLVLEQALRDAVHRIYQRKDLHNLTVKRIRQSVEEDLKLQEDFFKQDSVWKEKSKTIIQSEVVRSEPSLDVQDDANISSQQSSSQPARAHPSPKPKRSEGKSRARKRPSSENFGPKKRRKKDGSDGDRLESDKEALDKKLVARAQKPSSLPSPSPGYEENEKLTQAPSGLNGDTKTDGPNENAEASESDMSEVLDEAPKRKSRSRKSGSAKPKAKKTDSAKGKKAAEMSTDPDAEEIKRLQSWLVKCGIRKMWYRELAPYEGPKSKIRHLREMLTEAGMTGRYSAEKANQIKEARELKADLEAVQEGDKHWGQSKSEEEDGATTKPRRLAKSLQGLDFLNDDDGEETD